VQKITDENDFNPTIFPWIDERLDLDSDGYVLSQCSPRAISNACPGTAVCTFFYLFNLNKDFVIMDNETPIDFNLVRLD